MTIHICFDHRKYLYFTISSCPPCTNRNVHRTGRWIWGTDTLSQRSIERWGYHECPEWSRKPKKNEVIWPFMTIPLNFLDNNCLVGQGKTPLKNMSSSIGMMNATQYFWENAKLMAVPNHQPDSNGLFGTICHPGWWLGHPSEKYEFVNWDDECNPIYGKIKFMATKPPSR